MDMLNRFNSFIEKWIFLTTPICVTIGVIFADVVSKGSVIVSFVFAIMTFIGAMKSSFSDVLGVFKKPLPLFVSIIAIHVIMPIITFAVGSLFFGYDTDIVTGMVIEFAVPTAVVGLMWVTIYNGSSPFSLSLIITDTLLAPFLIPITLKVLVGSQVQVDAVGMMTELLLMIALPAVLAMLVNQISGGKTKKTLPPKLAPYSKFCLIYVQICNSSKAAPYIKNFNMELFEVTVTMLCLAALGYGVGWILSMLMKQKRDTFVSMVFGIGMRNISAGAVIAAEYFPPATVFPVIIATLFQQVLAAAYGVMIKKRIDKTEDEIACEKNLHPMKNI